jgi:hypothetical protein
MHNCARTWVPEGTRVELHRGAAAFAEGTARVWVNDPETATVGDPEVEGPGTRDGRASNMSPQMAITNTTRSVLPRRLRSPGAPNLTFGHPVELDGDKVIGLWRLRS